MFHTIVQRGFLEMAKNIMCFVNISFMFPTVKEYLQNRLTMATLLQKVRQGVFLKQCV